MYRPAYFVELNFDEIAYINSTPNDIDWGGHTWIGAGVLTEITSPSQNIEMRADTLTLMLTGVPVSKIAEARAQKYRNRYARIYLGLFDEDWHLSQNPLQVFSGKMDTMAITSSGAGASIAIDVVSDMGDWLKANTYRYTNEMQQARFSGDLGLEFVARQADNKLEWGGGS